MGIQPAAVTETAPVTPPQKQPARVCFPPGGRKSLLLCDDPTLQFLFCTTCNQFFDWIHVTSHISSHNWNWFTLGCSLGPRASSVCANLAYVNMRRWPPDAADQQQRERLIRWKALLLVCEDLQALQDTPQ